jgi:23S rRNA pseudouridine2457 synthase
MTVHRNFILYKPFGYLSQFVTNDKSKKKLLGELFDFPVETMAIGRLDADSEGLLFLTTNGLLSEKVRSSKVEKEYFAQLDGLINDQALNQLRLGVEIGFEGKRYSTKPCRVEKLLTDPDLPVRTKKIRHPKHGPTCWISLILNEGKFRQVRKMTAAVGFPTLRLLRVRIGSIQLKALKPGEVMEVDDFSADLK